MTNLFLNPKPKLFVCTKWDTLFELNVNLATFCIVIFKNRPKAPSLNTASRSFRRKTYKQHVSEPIKFAEKYK